MFPTLTSFARGIDNPYMNRNVNIVLLRKQTSTSAAPLANSLYPTYTTPQTTLPTSSKLLISNLPLNFSEDLIYKFLRTYGKIKSLELIKDAMSSQYLGQCHVEYTTEQETTNALHCILFLTLDVMGINLQGNILYIKRSSGLVPMYNISTTGGYNSGLGLLGSGVGNSQYTSAEDYVRRRENTISKVICVRNMVSLKELEDDDEYEDLCDDVRDECKNYGKVVSIKIPRPEGKGVLISGLGKVYVEYISRDGATFARDVTTLLNLAFERKSFQREIRRRRVSPRRAL